MKVVVCGGSGFLGSHVADELSAQGHDVTVFDNTPSPWLQASQRMVLGDLLDRDAVYRVLEGAQVVYNFAGLADLNAGLMRPLDTVRLNIEGHVNILDAARDAALDRVLYASTVYVFSRQGGFYRCSKQAAERYTEAYHEAFGLPFTILRYGSLYGPRSDIKNGMYRIIRRALAERLITYDGSPDAMREYIHVRDAARASVLALGGEFALQHVLLSGQEPIRVSDLLHMLGELLGMPDAVRMNPTPDPGHYVRTPYSYQPSVGMRYVPPMHVHFAQGLLELVEHVAGSLSDQHE